MVFALCAEKTSFLMGMPGKKYHPASARPSTDRTNSQRLHSWKPLHQITGNFVCSVICNCLERSIRKTQMRLPRPPIPDHTVEFGLLNNFTRCLEEHKLPLFTNVRRRESLGKRNFVPVQRQTVLLHCPSAQWA